MITQPAPEKPEPFTYKPVELPAPPITEQADVDDQPQTLRPAWEVWTEAKGIAERVGPAVEQIANNPHLTDAGKRDAVTKLALENSPKLRELLGRLEAPEAALSAQAEQLQQTVALPDPSDSDERIAEAFGRKNEQQRIKLLGDAMNGKDPALAKALATAHPILHGLGQPTVEILRSQLQTEKLDAAALERTRDVAFKLNTVRRTVTMLIESLEKNADREQMKAAKLTTLRRSDMSTQEKTAFIDARGLAAFKDLPE